MVKKRRINKQETTLAKRMKKIGINILLILVIVFLSISIAHIIPKYKKARKLYDASLAKKAELKEISKALEGDIERSEDISGQERALREKLRVTKEGEELIIIVPETDLP